MEKKLKQFALDSLLMKNIKSTAKRKVLKNFDLDCLELDHSRFYNIDFSGSSFKKAYFEHSIFKNCNFNGCDFADSILETCAFIDCDLKNTVHLNRKEVCLINCKIDKSINE